MVTARKSQRTWLLAVAVRDKDAFGVFPSFEGEPRALAAEMLRPAKSLMTFRGPPAFSCLLSSSIC